MEEEQMEVAENPERKAKTSREGKVTGFPSLLTAGPNLRYD